MSDNYAVRRLGMNPCTEAEFEKVKLAEKSVKKNVSVKSTETDNKKEVKN